MATHGTLGPFEQGKEDWISYVECLEQYFAANDVIEADKQRAILLSVCGASTYQVIRNLTAPKKTTEHNFKELVTLVEKHYCPPPSVIVQRFTFNTRSQKEGETTAEFVAELHRLSEHCKFAETLDDMLRDRLVCGIRDSRVQRRLLAEPELTFAKAFELSQATELAEKNAKDLQTGQPKPILAVHQSGTMRKQSSSYICYRCNSSQHSPKDCRFKMLNAISVGRKDTFQELVAVQTRRGLYSRKHRGKQNQLISSHQRKLKIAQKTLLMYSFE